ncbi:Longin-like domain-containing protein [Aspergillus crustosus]
MAIFSLIIINKAGGLIYQREFQPGLRKLSTNDYLVLAGTFHGVHAITRTLTPRIPKPLASNTATTTPTPSTPTPQPSSSSTHTPTLSTATAATSTLPLPSSSPHPPSFSTPTTSGSSYPIPSLPRSGLQTLESDKFHLTCFQTLTGTKFLLFTDPLMQNVDVVMRNIYELYADYVMKNPFYQIEMPVRCEGFDRGLGGYLRGRA